MAEEKVIVQCALCKRAVWNTDVNSTGRCVDCEGKRAEPEEPSEEA